MSLTTAQMATTKHTSTGIDGIYIIGNDLVEQIIMFLIPNLRIISNWLTTSHFQSIHPMALS